MNASLVHYGVAAFVTLLVVVDPFGIVPLFGALTGALNGAERTATLSRAVRIGFGVALFFLVAGRAALSFLGVTVNAFAISGGVLLFATALPMLFGHRGGLQAPEPDEQADADVSVFPLAIPLLSGPGTITTILLLTAQARGDWERLGVLAGAMALVFWVAYGVLAGGEWLLRRVGASGARVATRVLGIVLAALAVQFVLNGVAGYVHSLR